MLLCNHVLFLTNQEEAFIRKGKKNSQVTRKHPIKENNKKT